MIKIDINLLFTIINLVVLYLLLKKFLFKPLMGVMEKREALIAEGLKNASDAQDDANKLKAEYEAALTGAREESAQIVEKARGTAQKEYDRILGEADEKAGSMLEAAKKNIEIERQQTMNALQSEIAGLAMEAAKKVVGDKTGNGDLYDQFLEGAGAADENRE